MKKRNVAICRHPLDVVASLYRRSGGPLVNAIERWNRDNTLVVQEVLNGNIAHVVKYEDLVTDPESVMRSVQRACGLTVHDGLSAVSGAKSNWYSSSADAHGAPAANDEHDLRRQKQINQSIFDGRGRYKNVLSESQASQILARTKAVARQLDYGDTVR